MKHEAILAILADIKIFDRLFIVKPAQCHPLIDEDGARPTYGWHLQVTYNEADIDTGKIEQQYSRKWYIADDATESDVVDTVFAAVMRSYDHVVQEHFTYKGKRIFSPHFTLKQRFRMVIDQEADAARELCACGFDLSMRDLHFRNMHNATCPAKVKKTPEQEEQTVVEQIVSMIEHGLSQGLFPSVDDLLQTMRVDDLPHAALVAALSITYHAKDKLKHRDKFLARVTARLKNMLGDERAENLLRTRR